jgi:hypothetical protein
MLCSTFVFRKYYCDIAAKAMGAWGATLYLAGRKLSMYGTNAALRKI